MSAACGCLLSSASRSLLDWRRATCKACEQELATELASLCQDQETRWRQVVDAKLARQQADSESLVRRPWLDAYPCGCC